MRGLLAVSATGTAPAPPPAALAHLGGGAGTTVQHHPQGWVAFTPAEPGDAVGGEAFTVRLTRAVRDRHADLDSARLAALLGDGSALAGEALAAVLPPFAAAHRAGPAAPVVVVTDWLGLRHLYWWQGNGVAAVATSALALAGFAGGRLDTAALGVQSLLGWQLGLSSGFQGVTKLAPGCAAVLHPGRVEVRRYAGPALPVDPDPPPVAHVVGEMATILRDLHRRYLADHPDTVLQLSGGQDSRLQLAAVPPEQRRGLRAFTLDVRGGRESAVARRLAAATGLDHEVIWLDERPPVSPAAAHAAALAAAAGIDGLASPLALAPLALVEADLAQGHRLSGTGGETARGFYYPGQPRRAARSPALLERLARWRLFTNEAVETSALEPEFAAAAPAAAGTALRECFADLDTDWLRATDEFYLWQRVHRWAGAHDTVAAVERYNVNSLLDRRFLRLALTPDPERKRGGRLAGALAVRLDPALARIPLDSGLVPARLAAPGAGARVAAARHTAGKATRKFWQRVRSGRRSQLGAGELAGLVVAHWRTAPEVLAPVHATGLVRPAWLDGLLEGRREAAPTTVAFLVNLLVLAEAAKCRLPDSSAPMERPGVL